MALAQQSVEQHGCVQLTSLLVSMTFLLQFRRASREASLPRRPSFQTESL